MRGRFHARCLDALDRFRVGQDIGELTREQLLFVRVEVEPGEPCNALDVVTGESIRHVANAITLPRAH